jgi:hypothetical protein
MVDATVSIEDVRYAMDVNGCHVFESVVPHDLCARMRTNLFTHYERIRPYQIAAGIADQTQWAVHHPVGENDAIHDFLAGDFLHDYITAHFDDKPYILNGIGAPINPPSDSEGQYEHGHRWHRDARTFAGPGKRQLVVMFVMVDAFTLENGATEWIPGSHRVAAFPAAEFAAQNARRLCGPRGSIAFMDGDLWHRAQPNLTAEFRAGLTCVLTRPNFKQQLDYPRFLPLEYAAGLNPRMRQLFGFNARTPATLSEWYQPREQRFYRADQE